MLLTFWPVLWETLVNFRKSSPLSKYPLVSSISLIRKNLVSNRRTSTALFCRFGLNRLSWFPIALYEPNSENWGFSNKIRLRPFLCWPRKCRSGKHEAKKGLRFSHVLWALFCEVVRGKERFWNFGASSVFFVYPFSIILFLKKYLIKLTHKNNQSFFK